MVQLMMQNIRRWRMRFISIGILVALTFVLHVLYAGFLASSQNSRASAMPLLELPYDIMITVAPGERILGESELPEMPYTSNGRNRIPMIDTMERAAKVTVDSVYGAFTVLGVEPGSKIYTSSIVNVEGNWLQQAGDIVLPRGLAEQEGVQLGARITVSAWENYAWQKNMHYASFTLVGIYDSFDIQPALVQLNDAVALTASGLPNSSIITYPRERANNLQVTTDDLVQWIRPVYPTATIVEARLPEQISQNLLSRIYQPGQSLLLMIVVFMFIGVLTIAVMTYLERRPEFAALKTLGASKQQLLAMFCVEYTLATVGGLICGCAILFGLSYRIAWLGDQGTGSLLGFMLSAALISIAAVFLAVLYPVVTSIIASVNQMLYARVIPLATRRSDHMNNPASELVYREREDNLRFVRVISSEEADAKFMLLKNLGDTVKRGEVVAVHERFFGFYIVEWSAFCDGVIAVLDESGLIGIQPNRSDEAFYPYPAALLEVEQRRRRVHNQAVRAAQEAVQGEASTHEGNTKQVAEVVDFAAVVRAQQKAVEAKAKNPMWKWIWPALGVSGVVAFFIMVQQGIVYQRNMVQPNNYRVAQVAFSNMYGSISGQGTLRPHSASEVIASVAGQLETVYVEHGTLVAKGQPLFQLSNPEVYVQLQKAHIDTAVAQLAYDTLLIQTNELGNVDAHAQYVQVLSSQGYYERMLREQEKLVLVAPSQGIITEAHAQMGDFVAAGQTLFGFYDSQHQSDTERDIALHKAKETVLATAQKMLQLDVSASEDGIVMDLSAEIGQNLTAQTVLAYVAVDLESLSEEDALAVRAAQIEAERLQQQVDRLRIIAPFGGLISGMHLQTGDDILAGQRIGMLGSEHEYTVQVRVPQQNIAGVHLGHMATISSVRSANSYVGKVTDIALAASDPAYRAVAYSVTIQFSTTQDVQGTSMEVVLHADDVVDKVGPFKTYAERAKAEYVTARVPGSVSKVHIANGDSVREGDVLATLHNDSLELRYAQAEQRVHDLLYRPVYAGMDASVAQVVVQEGERVQQGQLLLQLEQGVLQATYASMVQAYEDLLHMRVPSTSIRALAAGTVQTVLVQPGMYVEAGQVVAVISNTNLDEEVHRADIELRKREAAYQAIVQNPSAGALELAWLQLTRAKNVLHQYEQASENLVVRAAHDGVVHLQRLWHPGESIGARQPLGWVYSDNDLEFSVPIDEMEMVNIYEGMPVALWVHAHAQQWFLGEVRSIADVGEKRGNSVVFMVRIGIAPDDFLRSGMTVSVYIPLWERESVLALPPAYIYKERVDGETIEKVNRIIDGRLVATEITTGLRNKELVEITSGLREGDLVLVER